MLPSLVQLSFSERDQTRWNFNSIVADRFCDLALNLLLLVRRYLVFFQIPVADKRRLAFRTSERLDSHVLSHVYNQIALGVIFFTAPFFFAGELENTVMRLLMILLNPFLGKLFVAARERAQVRFSSTLIMRFQMIVQMLLHFERLVAHLESAFELSHRQVEFGMLLQF